MRDLYHQSSILFFAKSQFNRFYAWKCQAGVGAHLVTKEISPLLWWSGHLLLSALCRWRIYCSSIMASETLQPLLDFISSSKDSETKADACDTLSFDIIPLNDDALCCLNWRTLVRHGSDSKFSISTQMYNSFISKVRLLMRPNTYHNFCHVNDVAQTVGCILQDPKCSEYFNDLDVFTCIITAIIHDLDHPGKISLHFT